MGKNIDGYTGVLEKKEGATFKVKKFVAAPASATDKGEKGEVRIVAGYIYVCTATDTWTRAALTTW